MFTYYKISNGIVRPHILKSGEIVTEFTLGAEEKSQNFTGTPINRDITRMESNLYSSGSNHITSQMIKDIKEAELFWDQIMMEHALFIRGLLDPTKNTLMQTSDNFAKTYTKKTKTTIKNLGSSFFIY